MWLRAKPNECKEMSLLKVKQTEPPQTEQTRLQTQSKKQDRIEELRDEILFYQLKKERRQTWTQQREYETLAPCTSQNQKKGKLPSPRIAKAQNMKKIK
jgi:hypothetical protein